MDKPQTLYSAIAIRSEQLQQPVLGAEEVRALGAALALEESELISVLDTLAKKGQVGIGWGGHVRVLAEGAGGSEASGGGPQLSGHFYGPVTFSEGANAQFDQRGSGQGATYNEGPAVTNEDALGEITAALVELRATLAQFTDENAAQLAALETAASNVTKEARKETPDPTTLRDRLQGLTAKLEDVRKLQDVAVKLEPTLRLMRSGAEILGRWVVG